MLPKVEIGQVWTSVVADKIHKYCIKSHETGNTWNVEPLGDSFPVVFFMSDHVQVGETVFYLHGKDELIGHIKPEPEVGQVWIGPGLFFKIKEVKDKVWYYTTEGTPLLASTLKNFNFAGWYDTTLMKGAETVDLKRYPHKCPGCKGPAYLGFNQVDCSRKCRK